MKPTQIFPSTRSNVIVAPSSERPPPERYAPIDCDFTDDLEFASVYRIQLEIKYWSNSRALCTTKGVIKDIVTEPNKEEFLVLDHDLKIRLDHLHQLRILDEA